MRIVRTGARLNDMAVMELEGILDACLQRKPRVAVAVSGGRTPWPILRRLAETDVDWRRIDVYQVDERVAPRGDSARNLTGLEEALLEHVPAMVFPMPVEETDLVSAAERYAASLPPRFDLIHLGLGDDGHTASLVPGDPVLDVVDRGVALTEPYRGHRRMTLTFPTIARADSLVWIVAGVDKASMCRRLVAADASIPAGRVPQAHATLIADAL